jgi:hypothetical protein
LGLWRQTGIWTDASLYSAPLSELTLSPDDVHPSKITLLTFSGQVFSKSFRYGMQEVAKQAAYRLFSSAHHVPGSFCSQGHGKLVVSAQFAWWTPELEGKSMPLPPELLEEPEDTTVIGDVEAIAAKPSEIGMSALPCVSGNWKSFFNVLNT